MERGKRALHKDKRLVLFYNLENLAEINLSGLDDYAWDILIANSLAQVDKVLKNKNVYVAIASLSNDNQEKVLSGISHLAQKYPYIKWIAFAVDDKLKLSSIIHQFSDYFIDYFHLPLDWPKLAHTLGHAYGMVQLQLNSKQTKSSPSADDTTIELIGQSDAITKLKAELKKLAEVDCHILISGETGTGKDLCAQLIHQQSQRARHPFININCGALPESLIHSELFGHEKGAFTGAINRYIGHIERAENGTLFLDEIGDLPLELQVNLLHFLENHTIERIGGTKPIKVNCRIIAATHVDLENTMAEGRFRKDLYHRLNVLRLRVPSLREHREDIIPIAKNFLKSHQKENPKLKFSDSAIECLLSYDWPGNVRELKNRVERAAVMHVGNTINEDDLGHNFLKNRKKVKDLHQQREDIDAEILLDAIARNNHNISAAARELKISRTTFYRLIKKCKIKL